MLRHRGYKTYYGQRRPAKRGFGWFGLFSGNKKTKRVEYVSGGRTYKNPYRDRNHLPRRTRAPRFKAGIIAVSLLATLGTLLLHPFFNISRIEVSGANRVPAAALSDIAEKVMEQKRWLIFSGQNYFLLNLEKITKEIKNQFVLENLQVNKNFLQIKITVQEKQPKLLLCNTVNGQAQYYLLDSEGVILQETGATEAATQLNTLPRLEKVNVANIKVGGTVVPKATLEFIIYLYDNIYKNNKIAISYVTMADESGKELNLVTEEGWKIIVDRQNDWEKQLGVLNVMLRDKIKDNRKNLHYIDVRYENRSFYQ